MQGNHAEAFEWLMKFLALRKADEETVQTYKTAYQTSGWQGVLRERVKRFDKGNEAYFYGASYTPNWETRIRHLNIWRNRINGARCGCICLKLNQVLMPCATIRDLMNWSSALV